MNTSEPCSKCALLQYDVMHEDDPSYTVECTHDCAINTGEAKDPSWCSWYSPWEQDAGKRKETG